MLILSILTGQRRYAHITALRGDGINPWLLGVTKLASEDSDGLPPRPTAPIATGWSDSCRAGFAPAGERDRSFSGDRGLIRSN
ncbi:MAG: hypothetical protein OXI57_06830, partial [Rhodospirillales bacterium]|nr:hypothetical protein [Rhodospirillales bacterium]